MKRPALSRRIIEIIAENRIQEAMTAGEFDDLPGTGKPIPGAGEGYDPHWWVRSWIERERLKRSER